MPGVDRVFPSTPLEALELALTDLEAFATEVPRERFESDRRTYYMVRDALLLAAQAAVDLALGICRRKGLGLALEYKDSFRLLASSGLLDPDLAREMEGWAGLRNVLVHMYTKADLDIIHRARTEELGTLRAFLASVASMESGVEGA